MKSELELLMKGWTDEDKQVVYDKAAHIEARIEQQKLINKGSNVNEGWYSSRRGVGALRKLLCYYTERAATLN